MYNKKRQDIKNHTDQLERIYSQRRTWLYSSSIVYTGVILLIFNWDVVESLHNSKIWWVIVSLSLLVSVNWWYWTMASLSTLIRSMYDEYNLLDEIAIDLTELKNLIKEDKTLSDNEK